MKDKIDLNRECPGPCGQAEYVDKENYAECIPWNAAEETLVLGGTIVGAPYAWEDFMVAGSEIKAKHSGLVMDVKVDEEAYQLLIKTFGTSAMLFAQAGGHGNLTRAMWKKTRGTDPLKGMLIKTLNLKIRGHGVKGVK